MGQGVGGFRGGIEEKEENAAAGCQEKTVVEDVFLFGGHGNNPVKMVEKEETTRTEER
jgi:hypothetical protein